MFSFWKLGNSFLQHFEALRTDKKTRLELLQIRQNIGESLSSYLQRFNKEVLMTKDCIDSFYVEAFRNGLVKGEYSHQLNIREPRTTNHPGTLNPYQSMDKSRKAIIFNGNNPSIRRSPQHTTFHIQISANTYCSTSNSAT